MNWSAIDVSILGPALLAGLLVLASHVPLGMQVLDRGIVFIDLAIAQIAGLGVIAADALGLPEHGLAVQGAALVAALLGAGLLTFTERRAPAQQEALIGVLFVLAASVGLLLLASNPHGGEHLKDLLVGQILWVGIPQLLALAAVAAGTGGPCGWPGPGGAPPRTSPPGPRCRRCWSSLGPGAGPAVSAVSASTRRSPSP